MGQERTVTGGPELGRWILVGLLLIVGLILFFVYAPASAPPAPPIGHEGP